VIQSTAPQLSCRRQARRTTSVYRIVDGADRDWASWYADWLLRLSELPQILGTTPIRSELIWLLVNLDKDYTTTSPDTDWPAWYAERIVEHFGANPD
jgi:hypothetical protein